MTPALVERVRDLPGFIANELRYRLTIPGHPKYEIETIVEANPLKAARLDYALSTGLTGQGQVISIIDDGIRSTHEQFDGKTIHVSGSPPEEGDFHGTAVASVAAGNGVNGGTLGFAPEADLHLGYMDYEANVSWRQMGQYMRDAAEVGAIASNNSWGLADIEIAEYHPKDYFSGTERLSYISGLRQFAETGVVVFALQNEYEATSANIMNGVPLAFPDLEGSWINVVNAIPQYDEHRILSADRISAACLETARYCMAANGQIRVATEASDTSYELGNGASFAAPQIAGSIALLAEAFPDLSAGQLRDRLLATADNSFFEPTAEYVFAPGITHGYGEEFGHGFLNLKGALLPIGEAVVPTQGGSSISVGKAAISAGPAAGDALAKAMASATIISLDGLYGSFTAPAAILGASSSGYDTAAAALAHAVNPAAVLQRQALYRSITSGSTASAASIGRSDPSAADIASGSDQLTVQNNGDYQLALLGADPGADASGFVARRSFDLGTAHLTLGASATRSKGSVMGVTVPGQERDIHGRMAALEVGLSTRIDNRNAFRIEGEFGRASGNGAGLVNDISTLDFNRVGATWDRADLFQGGDVLSLSLRAPIAITQGHASMTLPTSYSHGSVGFSEKEFTLAPEARQDDLGINYAAPLGRGFDASLGMTYSWNHGHAEGRGEAAAVFALHIQL